MKTIQKKIRKLTMYFNSLHEGGMGLFSAGGFVESWNRGQGKVYGKGMATDRAGANRARKLNSHLDAGGMGFDLKDRLSTLLLGAMFPE